MAGKRKLILHITPHFGGGVGRVLLGYLREVIKDKAFEHRLISLEYANEKALSTCRELNVELKDEMFSNHHIILREIKEADIVLVHWWNHPLLFHFLIRESLPPCRLVFWAHVSGLHPPYVLSKNWLSYPDFFVFTTPASLDLDIVKKTKEEKSKNFKVIRSTGGIDKFLELPSRKTHENFNVGYIGTVDICKLHPRFIDICARIKIKSVRFIVCGGPKEKALQMKARCLGISDKFIFTGHIDDVTPFLQQFDVFGYPLAPYHYGTCEQALAEAMAAAIPPVVMANPAELNIVEHMVTGIVASSEDEYILAVSNLYEDDTLRTKLGINAREWVREKYSLATMVNEWNKLFYELLEMPKNEKIWQGKYRGKDVMPFQVFVEALGHYGELFDNYFNEENTHRRRELETKIKELYKSCPLWQVETRGTPYHYHRFFPYDRNLAELSQMLRKIQIDSDSTVFE
jgi:glycosyltransferase involved in cell wall biosynthesis